MTNLIEYLKENAQYMDEQCVTILEGLNQDAFDRLMKLDEGLTGEGEPGIASTITITSGSVEDFDEARKNWCEKGERESFDDGIAYFEIQAVKGQQRRDLAVMDYDHKVLCLSA